MIRPATPDDAPDAARLIWESNGGIAAILSGSADPSESLDFYRHAFRAGASRLSFENALVLALDGRVVGALLAYHGRDAARLDAPLAARLSALRGRPVSIPREPREDEFYLDSLAVDEAWRGRGLGRSLLAAFETLGRERGFDRLGLLTERENAPAYGLYLSAGYAPDAVVPVGGHAYQHMAKLL